MIRNRFQVEYNTVGAVIDDPIMFDTLLFWLAPI